MKLFLMKICSLLVLAYGVVMLAGFLNVTVISDTIASYYHQLLENGSVPPLAVQLLLAALIVGLGLVGFLPSLGGRSARRSLVIPTENGKVSVQLEALRPALMRVLRRMPEVRKVALKLKPMKGRGKAHITANIVLRQQASLNVRQHVDIITQHIADSTLKLLGLENLAEIEVIVDGIKVDAKAAAREILSNTENLRARLAAQDAAAMATAALPGATAGAIAYVGEEFPAEPEEDDEEPAVAPVMDDDDWTKEEAHETDDEESELIDEADTGALPPLNPHPSDPDVTFNSDGPDAGYVLPPLSEQDAPMEVAGHEDVETAPVFGTAVEQSENEGDADGTETPQDPFGTSYTDDDETATLAPLTDDDAHEAGEHEDDEARLEPMAPSADEFSDTQESGNIAPVENTPKEEEKKRWSFF